MNQGQQLCIDALAWEILTAEPESRLVLWRTFEDRYVQEFRRAYPDVSESTLITMLMEASDAVQKRLNQLQAGERQVGCC